LQVDYHTKPMGGGESNSVKSDEGWTYLAPDTGLSRFIDVVCELARETPEEREKSVANLLMELEYMYKINKLSEEAEAEILYRQLLAEEVQDEQELANLLIAEDQLNMLQNAYINNIAARIKTFWRYQSAEDDWSAEVYVVQDRDGNVKAVDVKNANVGNSSLGKSFMDSIERAVYKASPLPGAPDDAVFDSEIYLFFSVN
jgi:acyl-CoA reductase-like NAD-dependent aldehyde dehydrogenase